MPRGCFACWRLLASRPAAAQPQSPSTLWKPPGPESLDPQQTGALSAHARLGYVHYRHLVITRRGTILSKSAVVQRCDAAAELPAMSVRETPNECGPQTEFGGPIKASSALLACGLSLAGSLPREKVCYQSMCCVVCVCILRGIS